ncbi:putative ABC transport system substrate-binding protein [Secundilactobacillus oryzae JCM 18671]|uniref:Putative ABC transport system substrate-binding protein n=1 Tax=Secundilactobacillus oryzae JCM 18671 TaxID=1291743 RepID=A0A081BHX9_9LACO|nr:tryptophan ABC transporter substrate-binding protein [Secundilactobacillus oryzae]GAK47647.1 putative ABC transport system substrate-binding protein [Secundilactobacillus oryzae JCM 18671]
MKRLYSLIAIILVFLGFAFVRGQRDANDAANQKKVPTVGILQLMSHPALDTIHRGILKGLEDEGYKPGKNVKIDFQNAENDQSNMKTMSARFVNENADAMIGIATPPAQALANASNKIPIVLGAITDPKGAGLVKSNSRPGGNVTGVSDQAPLEAQLNLIKRIMPKMKTLGIIYTSSDDSATAQYKMFKTIAKKENVTLKAYSIANTNDVNQVSQQMVRNVDAVYVPTDNTIASAMQTLVANANAAKVPVFPAVDTMVKDGGLATLSINQYDLGVETGKMTAQILKGKMNPAVTPIHFFRKGDMTVNLKQAGKLGIKLPQSIIKEAEKNGEVFK